MKNFNREDVNPETFYDIQDDATWAIARMMPQLMLIYSISIGLLGTVGVVLLRFQQYSPALGFGIGWIFLSFAAFGLVIALVHAFLAYLRPLDKFTSRLGAEPLDPEDRYHSIFKNVVEEISLAAPVSYVSARVIPTPRTNALAAGDQQVAEVMITEGALGQLSREELQTVVAHELAHIAYGDARLKLFTANILEIFEIFNFEKISKSSRSVGGFRTRGTRGRGALVILVLALLAPLLKGLNRIFATGISLQREWRADATAVEYSRNPLALARALYRLGSLKSKSVSVGLPAPVRDYRESVASPAYSQLLLVPFDSASRGVKEISWWEKLFLSHPPVENRIARTLNLARVPYSDFKRQVERERSSPQLDLPALRDKEGNLLYKQNWWIYADGSESETNLVDLLSGEGLTGEALIAREGDEDWSKPDQHRNLKAIKKLYENEKEKGNCPQCGAPFCRRFYLGVPIKVCLLCGGVALSWRKVIRLETRHRDGKLPERLGNIEDYTGYHGGEPIPEDEMIGAECPDCEIPFRTKRYHATKLIVDQCPNCNLTWFEEDELAIALNL